MAAQIAISTFQPAEYVPNIIKTEYINRISTAAGNSNTAVVGGSISNSLKTSTEVGMVWSTNAQPDYTTDPHSQATTVANVFTANLSGLSNGTTYYVCSYALDNNGRYYYGDPIKFIVGGSADGNLNFTSYSSPVQVYADDLNELDILLDGGTVLSRGTAAANPLINFTNANQLTAVGVTLTSSKDDFSIFLQGFFIPKETGSYLFTCEADDADDLYVDGLPLITQYGAHSASGLGSHTASISLTAGVKYAFRARMQERAGQEVLQVAWKSPSIQAANGAYVLDATEISSF
ncbi:hypothetical protein A5893_00010 [Pedobacter psychrophilus]|uniref:PA14 domain-containing protein n=1 Tax=Pedobacter psychrophilus TaxID=1826909 RepID=A0A179DK81_9SPHI|nr:hypothetical protein A5893_00010 [Pedobacter psychrophilus]